MNLSVDGNGFMLLTLLRPHPESEGALTLAQGKTLAVLWGGIPGTVTPAAPPLVRNVNQPI